MSNYGWIRIHRKLKDSAMYKSMNSGQRDVLVNLLMMVNFSENQWEWQGEQFECKPGQIVTSLDTICKECANDVKIQTVRSSLLKMDRYGFLTNESTKSGRLITICKWDTYQSDNNETNKDIDKRPTKSQQRANKEPTPIEEREKEEKVKKIKNKKHYSDEYEEVFKGYCKSKGKEDGYKAWKKLKPDEELKAIIVKAIPIHNQHWKTEGTEMRFIPGFGKWLNGRRWEDEFETERSDRPTHTPTAQPVSVNPDLSNQQKNHIVEDYHEHLAKLDINFHSQIRSQPNFFKRAAYKALNTYPKDVLDKEIYNHTGCVNSWDDIERALKTSDSQLKLAN